MNKTENLKIRPYARLLTMLGDQLIKDEAIALIELVKNAYDADAEHVKISFVKFNDDFTPNQESEIIIEDDGNGMDEVILKNAWMNPATPEKLKRKQNRETTDKGRIMQGEKGIGRFAIFKLGRKIKIITRRQRQIEGRFIDEPDSESEFILNYDFTDYDVDFLKKGNKEEDIYLEDLTVNMEERLAEQITVSQIEYDADLQSRKPYGTRIVISNLNGVWNKDKIKKVHQSILRMQPIFGDKFIKDFGVYIDVNGDPFRSYGKDLNEIRQILEEKAVFTINGSFNDKTSQIEYTIIGRDQKESHRYLLTDPEMLGVSPMRNYLDSLSTRYIECGPFAFRFYIFDLDISTKDGDTRYYLDKEEKESIKAHRVYLYRDGIRVMPYGDPEDDWLKLDVIRGIESAGRIFGNDQLVGYITISQKENPNLRDKTNREGLIEEGNAKEDLVNICQLILRYIRAKDYKKYQLEKKKRRERRENTKNKPLHLIEDARSKEIVKNAIEKAMTEVENVKISDIPQVAVAKGQQYIDRFLNEFEDAYRKEVDVLEGRITVTENLAAIGLSAETAYHDARIILNEADDALGGLINSYSQIHSETVLKEIIIKDLQAIRQQTAIARSLMSNIQRLFPSTKNKKKKINVQAIISLVKDLYSKSLSEAHIDCILPTADQTFMTECTDAVLLQVFINLFDNALYWLKTVNGVRQIEIKIYAKERTVFFSDSGPGVREEDIPYIFDPFFSGKGEDGKGLGLYIARQLLERYNSSIDLIHEEKNRLLKGANFKVKFALEEE